MSSTAMPAGSGTDHAAGSAIPISGVNGKIFGQTMYLVGCNAGLTGLAAYLARNLQGNVVLVALVAAIMLTFTMRGAVASSRSIGLANYYAIALLLGVALGPVLNQYVQQRGGAVVASAGAVSMLFLAAFGTVGYVTRRDLSIFARVSCVGLLVLIVLGIVLAVVNIPGGSAVYVVGGLAVFAGWTIVDFQRLRRAGNQDVVDLALSIYLDLINVFLFVLRVSE